MWALLTITATESHGAKILAGLRVSKIFKEIKFLVSFHNWEIIITVTNDGTFTEK